MQRKIIYFLTAIAFVLIILNIYVESNPPNEKVEIVRELFINEIDSIFVSTLFNNGIIEEWIEAKPISNNRYDSLKHVYYVDVPKDLRVVSLLLDITQSFDKKPVVLTAEEKENYSRSSLKIFSNNVLKFEAFLNPSGEVEREFAEICFIADATRLTKEDLLERLTPVSHAFTLLLMPSEEAKDYLSGETLSNASYVLLVSDNIDDQAYVLNPKSSKNALGGKIDNLVSNFRTAKKMIIDEQSAIYNSVAYSYVREKLAERNSSFTGKSVFIDLTNKKFEQVVSIFEFHCENGKSKQRRELIISIDDLIKLQPYIAKQRKLGNKFVAM